MDRNIFTYFTIMMNFYAGVNDALVADGYIITQKNLWVDFNILADFYFFADVSECAYKYIFTQNCR